MYCFFRRNQQEGKFRAREKKIPVPQIILPQYSKLLEAIAIARDSSRALRPTLQKAI